MYLRPAPALCQRILFPESPQTFLLAGCSVVPALSTEGLQGHCPSGHTCQHSPGPVGPPRGLLHLLQAISNCLGYLSQHWPEVPRQQVCSAWPRLQGVLCTRVVQGLSHLEWKPDFGGHREKTGCPRAAVGGVSFGICPNSLRGTHHLIPWPLHPGVGNSSPCRAGSCSH